MRRFRRTPGPLQLPKGWQGERSSPASRPVHVFHIGKTGGTALKQALLDHRVASGYELLLHGHDVRLAHVPPGESFMFAIRDPLSRFVSAFNGRLREDRPRYHYPWREEERIAFSIFETPDDLASGLSSRNRKRRKQAERAMRGIGHINTPYRFWFGDERVFEARAPDLFFIAFQETLDDDFELLKERLGLPPELRLPVDATIAHRATDGLSVTLGDVARANLSRWYAWDLAFVQRCRALAPSVNRRIRDEAPGNVR